MDQKEDSQSGHTRANTVRRIAVGRRRCGKCEGKDKGDVPVDELEVGHVDGTEERHLC